VPSSLWKVPPSGPHCHCWRPQRLGRAGLTIAASSHLQVVGYAAHGHGVVGATPRNAVLVVSYPPAGGGAVPPLSTESRSGQYTVAAAWANLAAEVMVNEGLRSRMSRTMSSCEVPELAKSHTF
jgi:hypothetical protein